MSQLSGEINTSIHPHRENTPHRAAKQTGMLSDALSATRLPFPRLSALLFTTSDSQRDHWLFPPKFFFFLWFALMAGTRLDRHHQRRWSRTKIKPAKQEKHPTARRQKETSGEGRRRTRGRWHINSFQEYRSDTSWIQNPWKTAIELPNLCGDDSCNEKCPYSSKCFHL